MEAMAARSVVLLAFVLLAGINAVLGFKAHEFKTCDQSNFCKRNRNREFGSSRFILQSGGLSGQLYKGVLADAEKNVQLYLQISAYNNEILRVQVNEHPNKKRFEVPDVLEPTLPKEQSSLAPGKKPKGAGYPTIASDGSTTVLYFGPNTAVLKHEPFSVAVYRGTTLVTTLNGKGLFAFEELREKREGDEDGLWEEDFRGHKDSKPKGPEAISFDVTFHSSRHVYGLAERATGLALKPTKGAGVSSEPYRLYNLDVFEYLDESPFGLYGSIPFMLSQSRTAGASGVFWLNAAEMWVDVLAHESEAGAAQEEVVSHWIAESGILDLFFFVGPTPKDVVHQYATVTGPTAMPQLFSIAYHQCRWNYRDEADVEQVDTSFDKYDIPYDVLWLDIEHTDGKKYMTWNSALFPNPVEMQNRIAAKGRKMVTIVDPHMKRDEGYPLHKEAERLGYYVKDSNGNDFDGWCWPGSSSYLDMLSPQIRAWWATKFSFSSYTGSTPILYIWNDMNEPSVFNGPEVTMQKDYVHHGGVEHRDVHNAYGYYYHMATAQGLLLRGENNDRPFVLSRAVFAGSQKIGPIWTGDNTADWNHLRVSLPMVLTLGLNGMAFSGADVGGFFGNPDAELLLRWYQVGVFYPFFRAHAHLDTKRREPWLFGEPYTSLIREAVRTRYSLLPYFYTLFREAATAGTPVMRPLFMEFPGDEQLYGHQDSFLVGNAILVAPVMHPGATSIKVLFPGADPWYTLKSGELVSPAPAVPSGEERTAEFPVDLKSMPVFVRGGTVVTRKDRARRSSSRMEFDPYTLVVALNSTLGAEGDLYIDDGHSYRFKRGEYIHRRFTFSNGQLQSTAAAPSAAALKSGAPSKGFLTPCTVERVIVLGLPQPVLERASEVSLSEKGVQSKAEAFLGPGWLRPQYPPNVLVVRAPGLHIDSDWTLRVFNA